jgi:predicted nucleotidyltransferase
VNPVDPNVGSVEVVAVALGELRDELVLVGGCAASLLIDTPMAPPPRVTYDVDLIAVVAVLSDYYRLERCFAERGFERDTSPDAPICRWRIRNIIVDLMPTDERVLGFSNRWYAEAAASANRYVLPGGTAIRLISAPAFAATKFEAFHGRGCSDVLGSHDLEDIINVVEGRAAFVEEVRAAPSVLRKYLARQFADLIATRDFFDLLPGLVAHDALHARRVIEVSQRLTALGAMNTEFETAHYGKED